MAHPYNKMEVLTMTKSKQHKLRQLDNDLLIIERQADAIGFDIDGLQEWQELTALVVAYQWGERRHSLGFVQEYGRLQAKVIQIMGV